jgi:aminoglycoside 6'-N-acetyltransferase I
MPTPSHKPPRVSRGPRQPPRNKGVKESLRVRPATLADEAALREMFCTLWPDEKPSDHAPHLRAILRGKPLSTLPLTIFVAELRAGAADDAALVGFIEVGLRSHANGCDGRRAVGFLEGWFVASRMRRHGVGAKLVAAAERWCRAQGCREMASDTWTSQRVSIAAHRALGYEVDCRCVNFRKSL